MESELAEAVTLLLRAGRQMQVTMARRLGIGETDVSALSHLVLAETPLGPAELGQRLGILSGSATVLVHRLVAAGHLTRDREGDDRRRVTLHTTAYAQAEVRQALRPLIAALAQISDRLDESDVRTVLAFLSELTATIHSYAQNQR